MFYRSSSLFVLVFASLESLAATYDNGINESSWQNVSSLQSCKLVHAIPDFGEAIFQTKAGESSTFFLNGYKSRLAMGQANIASVSPPWRQAGKPEVIGRVDVKEDPRPFWVSAKETERMLNALNGGLYVQIQQPAWYQDYQARERGKKSTHVNTLDDHVIVNNIGFSDAYETYLSCLSGLLPANFDQLKRSTIYFSPSGLIEIASVSERVLEHIAILLKYDPDINKMYIDGHASSDGSPHENLELSRLRSEIVADYLKGMGVNSEMMVLRWHGERYPVAANASLDGRSKNRRVTIRLEKREDNASESLVSR